jgi:UDP-N-acetyl-D-mannosaminuronic acid transferase (WecB/TagA/CpsF family)
MNPRSASAVTANRNTLSLQERDEMFRQFAENIDSSSVDAAAAREVGARACVPKSDSAGKLLQVMGRVVSGVPDS